MRNEEATLAVAKYIFENPLRAGLAPRVEDYPFLGSKTHSIEEILAAIADDIEHGPAKAGHSVPST